MVRKVRFQRSPSPAPTQISHLQENAVFIHAKATLSSLARSRVSLSSDAGMDSKTDSMELGSRARMGFSVKSRISLLRIADSSMRGRGRKGGEMTKEFSGWRTKRRVTDFGGGYRTERTRKATTTAMPRSMHATHRNRRRKIRTAKSRIRHSAQARARSSIRASAMPIGLTSREYPP